MCVMRKAANCPRYSYITYKGKEYYIEVDFDLSMKEQVMIVATDGSGCEIVDFNDEVNSHFIFPLEKYRIKSSSCTKYLFKLQQ